MKRDLYNLIDRCVLINLARRPDRLAAVQDKLGQLTWPFKPLEVVDAVDGSRCPHPRQYTSGGGAWGCIRSHVREIERALNDGIETLMILEDDIYFPRPDTFKEDVEQFMAEVPQDWDFLFLGGQHFGNNQLVKPGIVTCENTQRTHAYVIRGHRIMADLYHLWLETNVHCDWVLGDFAAKYKVYAPNPFLIGQDEGRSDISGGNNAKKSFNKPRESIPVFWFVDTERPVIEQLRFQQFHAGRSINHEGIDEGLVKARTETNTRQKVSEIKALRDTLAWEVESGHGKAVMLWCPGLAGDLIKRAVGEKLIVMENATVEQAIGKLAEVAQ